MIEQMYGSDEADPEITSEPKSPRPASRISQEEEEKLFSVNGEVCSKSV
jgi:hypothetical protein